MTEFLFHYKMTVTKVVDGDTIRGDVDLGFGFIQSVLGLIGQQTVCLALGDYK